MIDLHTHTVFSDGELIPFELAMRAVAKGYTVLGISDHVDVSNLEFVVPGIVRAAEELTKSGKIIVLAGVELTYVMPALTAKMVKQARKIGAQYVVVHGETLAEPVPAGINRAAVEAGVDILAHPGLITEEEARLAAEHNVCLEITARKGHSISNGHVAKIAREAGAALVFNTDSHGPGDLVTVEQARKISRGAGMTEPEIKKMFQNSADLVKRLAGKKQNRKG